MLHSGDKYFNNIKIITHMRNYLMCHGLNMKNLLKFKYIMVIF